MNRTRSTSFLAKATLAAALIFTTACALAERATVIPAPVVAEKTAAGQEETIVLAGGCFWGVQGVFQHVKGVSSAISGYAGGNRAGATYERVSTGSTGHAESVRVTFDPRQVSLGRILQVYFSVAHDPTQLNRQGPDSGTQYRSEIFAGTSAQMALANAYIAQLNQARVYAADIATRVEIGKEFYPAEAYHQNYLARNPMNPYILFNDLPKVASLRQLFPELYRSDPVLVASAR